MPGEVQVTKSADIKAPDGPQTDGMIRMPAIVDKSNQICGTGKYFTAALDKANTDRQQSWLPNLAPRVRYTITVKRVCPDHPPSLDPYSRIPTIPQYKSDA
jgi:hypothetical protein